MFGSLVSGALLDLDGTLGLDWMRLLSGELQPDPRAMPPDSPMTITPKCAMTQQAASASRSE